MEWIQNLIKAIDYIEDNLDGEIVYEEAARIACSSLYYFQRVFSYVAGMPLSTYVRRRRMTQAAFELQLADVKVQDVAAKYGYFSPPSFSRAFHSVHGVAPSTAREAGAKLSAYPRLSFKLDITGANGIAYRIIKRDALRFVGYSVSLGNDVQKAPEICSSFWQDLANDGRLLKVNALVKGQMDAYPIFGINSYQNKEDIRYFVAVNTEMQAPVGMEELKLPASEWAVFACDGLFTEVLPQAYHTFYTQWLPFSGYKVAEYADLEEYQVAKEYQKQGQASLWLSIEKDF